MMDILIFWVHDLFFLIVTLKGMILPTFYREEIEFQKLNNLP